MSASLQDTMGPAPTCHICSVHSGRIKLMLQQTDNEVNGMHSRFEQLAMQASVPFEWLMP